MPLDVEGARAVPEHGYLARLRRLDPDRRRFSSDVAEERADEQVGHPGVLQVLLVRDLAERGDMREATRAVAGAKPNAEGRRRCRGPDLRRVERRLVSSARLLCRRRAGRRRTSPDRLELSCHRSAEEDRDCRAASRTEGRRSLRVGRRCRRTRSSRLQGGSRARQSRTPTRRRRARRRTRATTTRAGDDVATTAGSP